MRQRDDKYDDNKLHINYFINKLASHKNDNDKAHEIALRLANIAEKPPTVYNKFKSSLCQMASKIKNVVAPSLRSTYKESSVDPALRAPYVKHNIDIDTNEILDSSYDKLKTIADGFQSTVDAFKPIPTSTTRPPVT